MKISKKHMKEKCPKCGSKEILSLGLDQMCCDCDWDNSLMLVQLGQLDNPFEAVMQQFGEGLSEHKSTDQKPMSPEQIFRAMSLIA